MAVIKYSMKTQKELRLADNFIMREFACKDGSDEVLIDDRIVLVLQSIRAHFDAAVTINSAYRTPAHNKAIGGSTTSKHMEGKAADITVKGVPLAEVAKYAEKLLYNGGIGLYNTFVHIDVRDTRYRFRNNNDNVTVVSGF